MSAQNLTDAQAWRRGVTLAQSLLTESEESQDDTTLYAQQIRAARGRQVNLVHRYLLELRTIDDPRIESAFCAVLSDFIGVALDCTDGAEYYDDIADEPIATSPAPLDAAELARALCVEGGAP